MPAKYNVRPFWPANPWDFITTNYGVEQDGTSGKPVLFSRKRFIVRYNEEPPIALEKIEGVGRRFTGVRFAEGDFLEVMEILEPELLKS